MEGRSYFLSPGVSAGFYELTINRLCWFPEWRIETDCLLLLSCIQARRDTRFKEKMAELPRRLHVPESSEGTGKGKSYKRCRNTCFCTHLDFYSYYKPSGSGANQRPFCSRAGQSGVFTSEAASANIEPLCGFRIWIKLEKQSEQ